jgi:hypothetical protein
MCDLVREAQRPSLMAIPAVPSLSDLDKRSGLPVCSEDAERIT